MDSGGFWQSLMVVLGPIALIVAIIWAMRHNRMTKAQERRSEQATRDMYEEQDRIDKANETR